MLDVFHFQANARRGNPEREFWRLSCLLIGKVRYWKLIFSHPG